MAISVDIIDVDDNIHPVTLDSETEEGVEFAVTCAIATLAGYQLQFDDQPITVEQASALSHYPQDAALAATRTFRDIEEAISRLADGFTLVDFEADELFAEFCDKYEVHQTVKRFLNPAQVIGFMLRDYKRSPDGWIKWHKKG